MMNMTERRALAIEWLGSRYVFHPDRHIQRIPESQQISMHKANVGETFRKEWERLAQLQPLIVRA